MMPKAILCLAVALVACLSGCGGGGAATTAGPTAAPLTPVQKLINAATPVFVQGAGTSAKKAWLDSVSSIDRTLEVHFKLPANTAFPGPMTSSNGNLTVAACNRTYTCPALDYKVCPGMKLNTAATRTFGETPTTYSRAVTYATPSPFVLPTFSWTATPKKRYSLIFVDFFQDVTNITFIPEGTHFFHGAWYNINGTDMTSAVFKGASAPGCPFLGAGNTYAFLLFEHDAPLSEDTLAKADASSYGLEAYNFTAHLAATTLTAKNLVSANWMNVEASVFSSVILTEGGMGAMVPPYCSVFTDANMCAGVKTGAPCTILENEATQDSSWMAF